MDNFVRSFPAHYPGKCAGCGDWFGVDEDIAYADDQLMHADCATEGPPPPRPTAPPCPSCWTVHAGECM